MDRRKGIWGWKEMDGMKKQREQRKKATNKGRGREEKGGWMVRNRG